MGASINLAPGVAQSSPTVDQCKTEWDGSSAAQFCGPVPHAPHLPQTQISVSQGKCHLSANCLTSDFYTSGDVTYGHFSGSVNEVSRLSNCNGDLKLDGC